MEDQIKHIISVYTKITEVQINRQTVIDRSAVASSIMLHRMYAHLAKEGFVVENYADIKNYGQLMDALATKAGSSVPVVLNATIEAAHLTADSASIGIDIEQIQNLPEASDYREDDFYKMNFAPAEIAYCILQAVPRASFAGLFAAKEAMIKADNSLMPLPFNSIVIDHLPNGKPVHSLFQLSIAHTSELAVAVAVRFNNYGPVPASPAESSAIPASQNSPLLLSLSTAALIISLLALALFCVKSC